MSSITHKVTSSLERWCSQTPGLHLHAIAMASSGHGASPWCRWRADPPSKSPTASPGSHHIVEKAPWSPAGTLSTSALLWRRRTIATIKGCQIVEVVYLTRRSQHVLPLALLIHFQFWSRSLEILIITFLLISVELIFKHVENNCQKRTRARIWERHRRPNWNRNRKPH